jgi:hypothetical protein
LLFGARYLEARQDDPGVGLHNARYQCGLLVMGFLDACYINSL